MLLHYDSTLTRVLLQLGGVGLIYPDVCSSKGPAQSDEPLQSKIKAIKQSNLMRDVSASLFFSVQKAAPNLQQDVCDALHSKVLADSPFSSSLFWGDPILTTLEHHHPSECPLVEQHDRLR